MSNHPSQKPIAPQQTIPVSPQRAYAPPMTYGTPSYAPPMTYGTPSYAPYYPAPVQQSIVASPVMTQPVYQAPMMQSVVPVVQAPQQPVIKGESRIEYIPYEKSYIEYEEVRQKVQVPRERYVTEYQAVEYQTEYIPQVCYDKVTEYVPVDRYQERVEYYPVERQVVQQQPVVQQPVIQQSYVQQPVVQSVVPQYTAPVAYQPVSYAQPAYVQPQTAYVQPQTAYVQPTYTSPVRSYAPQAFSPARTVVPGGLRGSLPTALDKTKPATQQQAGKPKDQKKSLIENLFS